MKTAPRIRIITGLCIALSATLQAQQKVSDRTELGSGALDPAADWFSIVDTSAGASGSKKISPNNAFTGWGFTSAGETLAKAANASAQRTALGLVVGTNVQAWDADLDSWSAKTAPSGAVVGISDTQTLTSKTLTSPVINVTSDATGDIYYRSSGGAFTRLAAGTDGHVLTLASGLPSWAAPAGGGGLSNFIEALNSSSPNTSVPVVSLTATNAASYVDVALVPKGSGGLAANVADGASTGGNKRGTRAVDWQISRSTSEQVASGNNSVIGGGTGNTAAQANSVVAGGSGNTTSGAFTSAVIGGGQNNTASNYHATISGGVGNAASGYRSSIMGGENNTASNDQASVVGGYENVASGKMSTAGGFYATTRGLYGMVARASGRFAAIGDAQKGTYILRRATTDATQTELSCDGSTPGSASRIILPNNSTCSFTGQLVARSSGGDTAGWRFSGTIERGANAAATAIIGSVTATDTQAESGASSWAITVDADTTNGSLRLRVTGAASTNIRWLATVETCELGY